MASNSNQYGLDKIIREHLLHTSRFGHNLYGKILSQKSLQNVANHICQAMAPVRGVRNTENALTVRTALYFSEHDKDIPAVLARKLNSGRVKGAGIDDGTIVLGAMGSKVPTLIHEIAHIFISDIKNSFGNKNSFAVDNDDFNGEHSPGFRRCQLEIYRAIGANDKWLEQIEAEAKQNNIAIMSRAEFDQIAYEANVFKLPLDRAHPESILSLKTAITFELKKSHYVSPTAKDRVGQAERALWLGAHDHAMTRVRRWLALPLAGLVTLSGSQRPIYETSRFLQNPLSGVRKMLQPFWGANRSKPING